MNYKAWMAKAAKQPMVLETVDLGPLGPRRLKSLSNTAVCVTPISPS
jgi:hypothetical protein